MKSCSSSWNGNSKSRTCRSSKNSSPHARTRFARQEVSHYGDRASSNDVARAIRPSAGHGQKPFRLGSRGIRCDKYTEAARLEQIPAFPHVIQGRHDMLYNMRAMYEIIGLSRTRLVVFETPGAGIDTSLATMFDGRFGHIQARTLYSEDFVHRLERP